jgi:hypothetical protein
MQVVFSTRATTSHLATLAHMGGPREVWGRGEGFDSWHPASPAGSLTTPRWGRRGGVGRGGLTAVLLHCCDPPQGGGGKQVAGRVSKCRRGEPHPTMFSSELNKG